MKTQKLLTLAEAAYYLNMPVGTLIRFLKEGELRMERAELDRWIDANTVKVKPQKTRKKPIDKSGR